MCFKHWKQLNDKIDDCGGYASMHGACIPYTSRSLDVILQVLFSSKLHWWKNACTKQVTCFLVWFVVAVNEMWNNWKIQVKGQFRENKSCVLHPFATTLTSSFNPALLRHNFLTVRSLSYFEIKVLPTSSVTALISSTEMKCKLAKW